LNHAKKLNGIFLHGKSDPFVLYSLLPFYRDDGGVAVPKSKWGYSFKAHPMSRQKCRKTLYSVETAERIYTGVHRIYLSRLAKITLQEL